MDPASVLGAAAASHQFLKEGFKLVQLIRSVCDKVQDAPGEIEAWRTEIEDLLDLVQKVEAAPALSGADFGGIIDGCRRNCDDLVEEFGKLDFGATDSLVRKTWNAIKGLDKEDKLRQHFEELQRLKVALVAKINLTQLNQGYITAQDVRQVASNVETIKSAIRPGSDGDLCIQDLFLTNPTDDRDTIITAKGHRVDRTCEWITSTSHYKTWIESRSGILWFSGGPGKGKTFLSIFLSETLANIPGTLVYFFCDNSIASRNTAVAVLRGLLYQLIDRHPQLLHHVLAPWKVQKDALFNKNSFESLWRLFRAMLADLPGDVYCVLDGLDECIEESLEMLLRKIETLFSSSSSDNPFKLAILSRRYPYCLENCLGSFPRIDLDSEEENSVQIDIDAFTAARVGELARKKNISQGLVGHIEETFRERSQGTFLWVSLMIHDLFKRPVASIEEALDTLPCGLDEVYKRILLQIRPDHTVVIADLLRWVTLSRYPLTVSQLTEAIGIKPSAHLSETQICLGHVDSCGHLLQVRFPSQNDSISSPDFSKAEVSLIHQSVKDYLHDADVVSFRVLESEGHLSIARHLLSCMQNEWLACEGHGPNRTRQRIDTPLAEYARTSWAFHLGQLEDEALLKLARENKAFFAETSGIGKIWVVDAGKQYTSMLTVACEYELTALVVELLQPKRRKTPFTSCGKINDHLTFPLMEAIASDNAALVEILLNNGAEVSGPRSTICGGRKKLSLALLLQSSNVFEFLGQTTDGRKIIKADLMERGWSLLHEAAFWGNERECRVLLEKHGYTIDFPDENGCGLLGPLGWAIRGGNLELARYMVDYWGAKTSPGYGLIDSARVLCKHGDDWRQSLDLIVLQWGVDINSQDEHGCTIFHRAILFLGRSKNCYWLLARCLVLGGDPSLRCHLGSTPFDKFSWFVGSKAQLGPIELVILLLQDGRLGINTCGSGRDTLLHKFVDEVFFKESKNGGPRGRDVFRGIGWLLDLGADRAVEGNHGMTARQLAIKRHAAILKEARYRDKSGALAIIIDTLDNYATVSLDPKRLAPLGWKKLNSRERHRSVTPHGGHYSDGDSGDNSNSDSDTDFTINRKNFLATREKNKKKVERD